MEHEPQDAYLPPSDREALEPFDVREQNSNKGMLILFGIILALVLIAILVLKMFAGGTRDRNETPRILADNRPYKEVPIDRGGEQTPNQDKEVYQKFAGEAEPEKVNIVPSGEKPLKVPGAQASTAQTPKTDTPKANIVIKPDEVKPPVPVASPKSQPKPKPQASSSRYVVQVASLRSQSEAQALWARLQAKMKGVITSAHSADIKKVNLKAKGTYYRLRIAGFSGKSEAAMLCKQLQSRKQECFVTQK